MFHQSLYFRQNFNSRDRQPLKSLQRLKKKSLRLYFWWCEAVDMYMYAIDISY